MRLIKTFFSFEAKRRFRVREIVIFLAVTLLLIFMAQDGKNKYLHTIENIKAFHEIESLKVQQYVFYGQYGSLGLQIMFIPPAYSTLFADPIFNGLLASVNTVERLNIYKGIKGRAFFSVNYDYMNLLGVILLLAVFFGLIYGYDTTRKKIFFRFLSTLANKRQIYIAAITSRILLLNLAFLASLSISLLWLLTQKINLFHLPILFVGVGIILVVTFFFAIGCIISSFHRITVALISLSAVYLCSIFLIPWLADKNSQVEAAKIKSLFDFELENVKISMSMEKRLIDKFGVYKSGSVAPHEIIKAVRDAEKKEHAVLWERENRMKNDMLANIDRGATRDAFFPILFYNSMCKTISGQGGLDFINFYSYCQEIKMQFIDFYVLKKFESENKPGEVESFVKGNENLYHPKDTINIGQILLGSGITLIYSCLALIVAYFLFLKNLYPLPEKDSADDLDIELARGEDAFIGAPDNRAIETFQNVLSGKIKGFTGKIIIDDENVVTPIKKKFVYLCNPDEIPGESTINSLLAFFKELLELPAETFRQFKKELEEAIPRFGKMRFNQLKPDQKIMLLLKIGHLSRSTIYVVHDLEREMSLDFLPVFKTSMQELKKSGVLVIYFGKSGHSLMQVDRFITAIKDGNRYHYREFSQH